MSMNFIEPSMVFDLIKEYERQADLKHDEHVKLLRGYDFIDTDEEEESLDRKCDKVRDEISKLRTKIRLFYDYLNSVNFDFPEEPEDFDKSDDLGLSPEYCDYYHY